MRLITTTTTIAVATLLLSGVASAAGSEKDAGKGPAGPAPGGESPGGGKTSDLADTRDRAADTTASTKSWGVGAGLEYHHTGLDGGFIDNGALRNVNYWSLFGRWDPTKYDRVAIRFGLYQSFRADSGESGARADDISLSYTRRIPLPGAVTMRVTGSFTLPVSYGSQLAGVYTVPKLTVQADRKFGRYVTLDARLTGGIFLAKYAEGGSAYHDSGIGGFSASCVGVGCNGGGANPNPKGSFSMGLTADFAMPFHTPLSAGLSLYTGYSWYHDVCGSGNSAFMQSAFGMSSSATNCNLPAVQQGGQPFQQAYGGEIYVRYALPILPLLGGFASDLALAFAPNGDPTMGYANVLHGTGLRHVYPFYYRQTAEVYASITGRY